jgi:cytochrome P450
MDFFQLTINMAQAEGFPKEKYPQFFSSAFVAVMFAAHTNLAGTLAWSLAHVGENSDYQDRCRNECESARDTGTKSPKHCLILPHIYNYSLP